MTVDTVNRYTFPPGISSSKKKHIARTTAVVRTCRSCWNAPQRWVVASTPLASVSWWKKNMSYSDINQKHLVNQITSINQLSHREAPIMWRVSLYWRLDARVAGYLDILCSFCSTSLGMCVFCSLGKWFKKKVFRVLQLVTLLLQLRQLWKWPTYIKDSHSLLLC